MKSYKEMAENVIRRIDEYEAAHKRKKVIITYTAASLGCVCFAALFGFGLWQRSLFNSTPQVRPILTMQFPPAALAGLGDIGEKDCEDESEGNDTDTPNHYIISKELQEQIDRLESQSKDTASGDILGWVVYEGRIYEQVQGIDISDISLNNKYLGRGSEFRGAYSKDWDAELYNVSDNPDLILVKLGNGSIIVLRANNLESYNNYEEIDQIVSEFGVSCIR